MIEVEAPGGCCPLCGVGKLIVDFVKTSESIDAPPNAFARFYCKHCGAEVQARASFYAVNLVQVVHDANEAARASFRETIGGFQFTD